ncbi:unnamed protein product [Symbiodinium sp. KB8]|nr:unnamed protein product [Symbiodinium sp. KB8]
MAGRGEGFRTMGTHTAASAEVSGVGGARARRHGDHECGKGEEEGRDAHAFVRTGVGSTGGRNTAALADNVELQILLAELSGGRMCRRQVEPLRCTTQYWKRGRLRGATRVSGGAGLGDSRATTSLQCVHPRSPLRDISDRGQSHLAGGLAAQQTPHTWHVLHSLNVLPPQR